MNIVKYNQLLLFPMFKKMAIFLFIIFILTSSSGFGLKEAVVNTICWMIIILVAIGVKKSYDRANISKTWPPLTPEEIAVIQRQGKEMTDITANSYSLINKPTTDYGPNWSYISQDIRARDGFKCRHCGSTENLHVHHIVPRGQGGRNHPDNLITLCFNCHCKVHPHMRNMAKNSYSQNDYNRPSHADENIRYQSSNAHNYISQNTNHNENIFCKQCGGIATLIDREADPEKLFKTFQCEECGMIYKKKYFRKSNLFHDKNRLLY